MKRFLTSSLGAMTLLASVSAFAQTQGQVVKIVNIDPLSGMMAPVATNQLRTFQFFAEKFSNDPKLNPAGVKFEVVGVDNKLSPQESVNALKAAIDSGVHFVAQGNGSSVAGALIDAINKHNERNPGQEVLYFNHSAVDPDFTNSKCSYWHFRFDADTSMKMEAMTTFIKDDKSVKKVYLLEQNYSHGQQVAKYAKADLAAKRPDIQIVGEDYTPLAQVRDFAPYIAKVKASGADTVITGNWGSDLTLMIKAAEEGGYKGKFYTYYAGATSTPGALGQNGAGKVYQISYGHYNLGGIAGQFTAEFQKKFDGGEDLNTLSMLHLFYGLSAAIAKANSVEPLKVAAAFEGLKFQSFNGEVEMRKADHQLQMPLYMTVWQKAGGKYPYSPEHTGMTLAPVREFSVAQSSTPTTCDMKRP